MAWRVDGRIETEDRLLWTQTDHWLVMFHNAHCEKGREKKFGDFNPYVKEKAKRGIPITVDNIHLLKMLIKDDGRRG